MQKEKCCVCGKAPLSTDETGLTKKLIDKNAVDYYCIICMAKFLEASEEELREKIEDFKKDDCIFFRY